MTSKPENGAFYIKAEDIDSKDSFKVPGDKTGYSPDDTKNPDQKSYKIDGKRRKRAKQYYVHVWNGWDENIQVQVRGSRFSDSEMSKSVVEQSEQLVESGSGHGFESDTGHSYIEVKISGLTDAPSSGVLEITFQDRYR